MLPPPEATVEVAPARTDPDALVARLFVAEGASLVRLARLFTDDRTAAEDLVQEAFVRLHRAAGRILEEPKAAAYLRSIVLNLARDHNRRGLMSLRHQDAQRANQPPEPTMDDRIDADAQQAAVLEALRGLPVRQRDCLALRFYLDLSSTEIADTLGISANSVKTHCRRGLASLRDQLGKDAS
jgi:RNA polymerase sigma-70 factor (sigma-E family)